MTRAIFYRNWHPTTAKVQPRQLWITYTLGGTIYRRFGRL